MGKIERDTTELVKKGVRDSASYDQAGVAGYGFPVAVGTFVERAVKNLVMEAEMNTARILAEISVRRSKHNRNSKN